MIDSLIGPEGIIKVFVGWSESYIKPPPTGGDIVSLG